MIHFPNAVFKKTMKKFWAETETEGADREKDGRDKKSMVSERDERERERERET